MIAYREGNRWVFKLTDLECQQLIFIMSHGSAYWVKLSMGTNTPEMVEAAKEAVELNYKFSAIFVGSNYSGNGENESNPIVLDKIPKETIDKEYDDATKNSLYVEEIEIKDVRPK